MGNVYRRLTYPVDTRLRGLTETSKIGKLTDAEEIELDSLIDQYDDYVLARSTALLLLKRRGYDIEAYLKSGV